MEIAPAVLSYRAALNQGYQAIFDRLTSIAQSVHPAMQNAIKWHVPTFTIAKNWHHWLFSITQTRKGISLTFHKGWLLVDPTHSLLGDGKHLRHLLFTDVEQINDHILAALIAEAVLHQLELA
jgi:hypothetical protein